MISHGNVIFSLYQAIVVAMDAMSVAPVRVLSSQAATIHLLTVGSYQPAPPKTPEGIPVTLAFLPFYHSFGLHVIAFRAFMSPTTFVMLNKWNIETALKAIQRCISLVVLLLCR